MPTSFDFLELKKGFFPYLAGPEFYNYEGPLLDRELYCVSGMKRKAAEEFDRCACMNAFRRNFLQKDTIGIVPPSGYHGMGKQSEIALKWLNYESHKLNTVIKTIYTDREVSIMGRRVDGYVEIPKRDGTVEKRIYQFHGDYWQQCPLHFPPASGCGENRLEQTKRITVILREAGYKVIEKWECQFKADLMNDPDTKAYFSAHPTTRVPPLNLRDSLAGGRTSALRWYHKADIEMGEKIKMVDVVCEYPGCNLRGKYHPHIFREGDQNIPPVEQWNGLVNSMPVEDSEVSLPTSSLVHAAFTTCFGRIQLYRYLDLVGKRALYHDIDNVAYISRPGQDDLPLGTHLGDLTDQIEEDWGPGSFITEMVCGGPKNYTVKNRCHMTKFLLITVLLLDEVVVSEQTS
ncbi:Translation initiation factor IF-2 [Frankliniella fusca]|uniref:Translation initiation factor IF-2 n=1 Tax=Frankliniella fusca TaxID=407009 RepID=A0AAE1LGA5_9NEOP|nr:Translation initiation factor IF-2 [Frankliniella fusca]